MEASYIISQILVIIAYIICGFGFLQKKRIHILIYSSIFNVLMLFQYLILNASMGVIANSINIIRNIIFIYNIKKSKSNSKFILFIFICSTISLTAFFYQTPLDIFPCFIALLGTFSYWISNTKFLRIANIFCSICYIIYAFPIKSYITIIAETYLIITTLIGYIRYEKKNKYLKLDCPKNNI